ncbi:MAG: 4-(cytidine 5'-diphospho)-2-C-methyl-D-erythritol kinase [Rhodospirillales bacterium]|jgi:4-diphosphocytidyl-2-C-methyl-D-erythritol kinase|nr:4-(cytidine 5'-diphospho)-2-C-methyl-D-erythritol kinase [Rhodospirillales bacterium]
MAEIALDAPAKINLYLHVTGRRDDGYHLLDSLIVFARVGDRIAIEPADDFSLYMDGPFAQGLFAGPDNLVLRAARGLAQVAGRSDGAHIRLTKNLPVASGIGGGSADAAATINALMRLWEFEPDAEPLAALALGLGADVPVCLAGQPSFVGGIGENIEPAPPLPTIWLVLANPGVAISTPAVFKARQGEFSVPARFDTPPKDATRLAALLAERNNDLADAACALAPPVIEVLDAIAARPGCLLARMSGSGATCFGIFDDPANAQSARSAMQNAHPDWWLTQAPMLT